MYEIMRYWDDIHTEWDADRRAFAAAWRNQHRWVVSRSLQSVGPNANLVGPDLARAIRELKAALSESGEDGRYREGFDVDHQEAGAASIQRHFDRVADIIPAGLQHDLEDHQTVPLMKRRGNLQAMPVLATRGNRETQTRREMAVVRQ
jgi:hypothetical protein